MLCCRGGRMAVAQLMRQRSSGGATLATGRALSSASSHLSAAAMAMRKNNGRQPFLLRTSPASGAGPLRHLADYPDHIRVTLPALSPTMEVGTIVSWEKKEGAQLCEGDLLCEIETDKATMGFETPEEGYLARIFQSAGTRDIPIGRLLCIIVTEQEDIAKFKDFEDDGSVAGAPAKTAEAAAPAAAAPAAAPPATPGSPSTSAAPAAVMPRGDRPFASPAAKKLAAERGIDLGQIQQGTGMDGMITTKDLKDVQPGVPGASAAGLPAALPMMGGAQAGGLYSDAELTNMRKTIAKRLQASKLEIPHYYLTVECRMDALMELRSDLNSDYADDGVKLSVNDFIIKATALASKRVPECNSAWIDGGQHIREYHTCDVSVAVDTGKGLITPIVPQAEAKGLRDISETVRELAGRAKEGKLQPHEFMGGSISVSNLGMFGIEHFTAIINPPQSCILAVGGTTKKLVPGQAGHEVGHFMKVTLSCDHRVVDGAVGAQWLKHFKKFMEKPKSMLL